MKLVSQFFITEYFKISNDPIEELFENSPPTWMSSPPKINGDHTFRHILGYSKSVKTREIEFLECFFLFWGTLSGGQNSK